MLLLIGRTELITLRMMRLYRCLYRSVQLSELVRLVAHSLRWELGMCQLSLIGKLLIGAGRSHLGEWRRFARWSTV